MEREIAWPIMFNPQTHRDRGEGGREGGREADRVGIVITNQWIDH